MEDVYKPSMQNQRRLNPIMQEVVRKEVLKWLDLWNYLCYFDSSWVSPITNMMLDRLAGYDYYCFLDGYSGYNQIMIAPEDQEKTTFTCPYGTFAFRRMPFVFGDSYDHCLNNLSLVLQRCEETNLVLNWEKCHFMVRDGIVLGHRVSSAGLEVDRAKVVAIEKLPPPTNEKAIRSFLGHAGFYRRFIRDFSKITKPLSQLLEKDTAFNFSNDCLQAFEILEEGFSDKDPF
ncbi:hypothetical protein DH2020_012360 [Rehmannia glutinosa]|uniref:Retrovirus-related Pol polyprotein from transposon 17.6 n=1 Tax=Rehmannia glutinosa TaxID=99300 RepID=A0ABR0WZI6_REHGL